METIFWAMRRDADVDVRAWPDGMVVYDPATGDVHVLSEAASDFWLFMSRDPERRCTAADWLDLWSPQLLGAESEADLDDGWAEAEQMRLLLADLHRIGLVSRSVA